MDKKTEIKCDCGEFKAELLNFPKNSPGRVACYCDDCQKYLEKIGRLELLDPHGGTEIIPVYPSDFKIITGLEKLKCNRLSPKGIDRWSTTCCNSPIANTKAKFPWVGINYNTYNNCNDSKELGEIKSRIFGKFKKGDPPFNVSEKMTFKDAWVVIPFIFKGLVRKKADNSIFYKEGKSAPFNGPHLLK